MDKRAQLQTLEYAVRLSMTVREDQEDPAEHAHIQEAAACGISITSDLSKGDLLSLVQTRLRAL